MTLYRPNAPPPRRGVGASCVVLPSGHWELVIDFLEQRFPNVARSEWLRRLDAGEVQDDQGATVAASDPCRPGLRLYYYRTLAPEPRIPFEATVLWRDAHLLVVDKPHFLPVMPSGQYLQETLLVRLRNSLGLADLAPVHRIDRDTAGLVLFSVQPASRAAYHELFRQRRVDKQYEAIARWNPALAWPITRSSRIVPSSHFMQQTEVEGEPNAVSHIAPLEVHGTLARYALQPVTGQRHQLRGHMAALGLPLVDDGIYPTLTPQGSSDFSRPLQLLAKAIALTDPISGQALRFESGQRLRPLPDLSKEVG